MNDAPALPTLIGVQAILRMWNVSCSEAEWYRGLPDLLFILSPFGSLQLPKPKGYCIALKCVGGCPSDFFLFVCGAGEVQFGSILCFFFLFHSGSGTLVSTVWEKEPWLEMAAAAWKSFLLLCPFRFVSSSFFCAISSHLPLKNHTHIHSSLGFLTLVIINKSMVLLPPSFLMFANTPFSSRKISKQGLLFSQQPPSPDCSLHLD